MSDADADGLVRTLPFSDSLLHPPDVGNSSAKSVKDHFDQLVRTRLYPDDITEPQQWVDLFEAAQRAAVSRVDLLQAELDDTKKKAEKYVHRGQGCVQKCTGGSSTLVLLVFVFFFLFVFFPFFIFL